MEKQFKMVRVGEVGSNATAIIGGERPRSWFLPVNS